MTPAELLAAQLRRDPARPLLTWYDDATGERVELSVATAANWAAKTANLLVDEHELDVGDAVRLDPPGHWLAVVAALGAWTAGITVDLRADVLAVPGPAADFVAAVLPQPDAVLVPTPDPGAVALVAGERRWSLAELGDAAEHAAVHHAVAAGARILSVLAFDTVDGLDAGLLVPLACGGSAVLVVNADPSRLTDRAASERVTHTAGIDVAGLPRLR